MKIFLVTGMAIFSFAFLPNLLELPELGSIPLELPEIDTNFCKKEWPDIVQDHLKRLPNQNTSKRETTQSMFSTFTCNHRVTKPVSKAIYKSSKVRRALYNWVKPVYLAQFKALSEERKKIYLDMLDHAESYLKTFDYQAELKVFKEFPLYFCYKGPKGHRGDFGRMEAFIFRRVHRKELSIAVMQAWVRIIKKDLKDYR